MDISKFSQKAGRLETATTVIANKKEKYFYFYPNPLPNELNLDNLTVNKLTNATLNLGELKGLTNTVSNIQLFIAASKKREAVLSSKIEGTKVSLTDIFLSEAGSKEKKDYLEILEVKNYISSLNYALEQLAEEKIVTKDLVDHMHRLLLQNVRGAERTTGQYRQIQNWIGRSTNMQEAEFIPPPAKFVPRLMNELFRFMKESPLPDLIKIGLMHYYFETIHPYEDGNGRLGRTLIILYLNQLKVIEKPILYISSFFEKNRDAYYELLMKIRREGDYLSWLNFFLEGVDEVSATTSKSIKNMLKLYEEHKNRLNKINATSISYALLDSFFQNPYSTIPFLQGKHKKNYPLIKRGIENLMKCSILVELTTRKRNKFYVAPEILNVIEKT